MIKSFSIHFRSHLGVNAAFSVGDGIVQLFKNVKEIKQRIILLEVLNDPSEDYQIFKTHKTAAVIKIGLDYHAFFLNPVLTQRKILYDIAFEGIKRLVVEDVEHIDKVVADAKATLVAVDYILNVPFFALLPHPGKQIKAQLIIRHNLECCEFWERLRVFESENW